MLDHVRWLTTSDADAGDANVGAIVICIEAGCLLDAFVDNELGPSASADLQAHLAACAACSQLLADRESLGRLVRQLPYYPASNELRARISRLRTRARFNPNLLAWAAVLLYLQSENLDERPPTTGSARDQH